MIAPRIDQLRRTLLRFAAGGGTAAAVTSVARWDAAAAHGSAGAGPGRKALAADAETVTMGDLGDSHDVGLTVIDDDSWVWDPSDGGITLFPSIDALTDGSSAIADASGGDYNFTVHS